MRTAGSDMPDATPGAEVGEVASKANPATPAKRSDPKNNGIGKGLSPHGNEVAGM